MRLLEILIPIFLSIYLFYPLTRRPRPAAIGILPAFSLVLVTSHVNIEGMRWQMYPLYAIAVITFLVSLPAFLKARGEEKEAVHPQANLPQQGGIFLALLLATALPALLPVPSLPKPTGPYVIGTATFALTDASRQELYGPDTLAPRKTIIQVWYPAQAPDINARPNHWMDDGEILAPALSRFFNFPDFFLTHLPLARSNSYKELPILIEKGPYPLILFSHGWQSFRAQSTFIMEDLASNGYIVVSTEHPYGATLTIFPDGQQIANNPQALPPSNSLPQDEYEITARKLVEQWSADIAYTLNTLEQWNANDPTGRFTGMIDLQKVGAFGHSTGGGATIQFCARDSRCKALIPLDPFMRPVAIDVLQGGLNQPSAYLFSEAWPFERNTQLFKLFAQHLPNPAPVMTILGTAHYDFTDLPALTPLAAQMGLKGPINGTRVQTIVRDYVRAFFNLHLKGIASPLFDGPSADYPEIRFER